MKIFTKILACTLALSMFGTVPVLAMGNTPANTINEARSRSYVSIAPHNVLLIQNSAPQRTMSFWTQGVNSGNHIRVYFANRSNREVILTFEAFYSRTGQWLPISPTGDSSHFRAGYVMVVPPNSNTGMNNFINLNNLPNAVSWLGIGSHFLGHGFNRQILVTASYSNGYSGPLVGEFAVRQLNR